VDEPPGLFTYIARSFPGSTESRNKSCATTVFATASSIGSPRNTIRSRNRRE